MNSDLPPEWGFLGSTARVCPAGDSGSKEEEVSYNDNEAPSHWTQTCSASEPSGFSDIFKILSNIQLQESPPKAETSDDSLAARINLGETEHGEPSNSNKKRRAEDVKLRKCLSEANEKLSSEVKRKEELKPKRTRSAETHNMSERRRRSRIKEKIRSLHQLIPKSDKKDCASILDETVRYLKTLKVQAQMMSMSMGSVYYNPYISATGMPNIPIGQHQYSPYVTFRPCMGLVPMVTFPSPAHSSQGIMPLVQSSMEAYQSRPLHESNGVPAVGQTVIPTSLPHLDIKGKGPAFQELMMISSGSQEAYTSGQVPSNFKPGSIVHATHTVPPSSEGKESNM